ncbi:hypothetical protein PGTUg99_029016 [Puccinia graminis f. sp. tritici]|uniref:Uncharacterized protein n=1 Tax=Puccinia graminis f. sp. tritici TaxID=56615 RepID=A0A5B0R7J0_PUCGR|nr:hypothetical protein PGTUg99_029016 [Puccinia graminis f. sp. tritici]
MDTAVALQHATIPEAVHLHRPARVLTTIPGDQNKNGRAFQPGSALRHTMLIIYWNSVFQVARVHGYIKADRIFKLRREDCRAILSATG